MTILGTGLEGFAADEFIYGQLSGDVTLQALLATAYRAAQQPVPAKFEIYSDTIPPDVTYPYIIFQLHTSVGDTEVTDSTIVWSILDYLVRVVERGQTYSTIAPIYSRVHQLLHQQSGVVTNGTVYQCRRIRPYKLPELDDAIQYRMMGGFYRLTVQA